MNTAVLIIIGLTVAISLAGFQNRSFLNKYKFQIAPIKNGDYIRMVSSGFLHVDYTHLIFNMLTLYFFYDKIIKSFGSERFVILYLASLIAGSVLSYVYHKNEPSYSAVGASGAVSGVLFSYILLNPFSKLYIMFIPVPIPAIVVGIGYLLYSVYGMKKGMGNIGHAAHLGGAAMGLLMTLIYAPQLITEKTNIVLILCIPLVALFILGRKQQIY
ncbi:MAG: rhomboid family intramembrane serine protease [Flavobacteriia bacterium]|nr:MAG: rhomboid family intramembrane serine protease [Flavobacteriia bacterium]